MYTKTKGDFILSFFWPYYIFGKKIIRIFMLNSNLCPLMCTPLYHLSFGTFTIYIDWDIQVRHSWKGPEKPPTEALWFACKKWHLKNGPVSERTLLKRKKPSQVVYSSILHATEQYTEDHFRYQIIKYRHSSTYAVFLRL